MISILVVIIVFVSLRPPTPQRIFNNHLQTVVEVRAWFDEAEENKAFGSAVAISAEGKFITNAHVISFNTCRRIACI